MAADPQHFLETVMMSNDLPLSTRMRAAIELMPYRHPKLIATAIINESSFADLLDRRIAKLAAMEQQKLIDHKPANSVEAKPIKENGGNADARLPPPIPDRRYRRI